MRDAVAGRTLLPGAYFSSRGDQLLNRWFELRGLYGPILNLYFASQYSTIDLQESRFLNLVHTIEGFHRRRFSAPSPSEVETLERVQQVVSAAPPQLKEWLAERLQYSHEPTLRVRLKDTVRLLPAPLPSSLLGTVSRFIDRVVRARQYLTHWDPKAERHHPSPQRLYAINESLAAIIGLVLLVETGVDDAMLRQVAQSNLRLINVSAANRAPSPEG
jgi:hypothetical protein